jgi:hypothetical protein
MAQHDEQITSLGGKASQILRDLWVDMDSLCQDHRLPEVDENVAGMGMDINFDEILEEQMAIEDSAMAFDRLVSFQDKLDNMDASLQSFLNHNTTLAAMGAGLIGGTLTAIYMATQGHLAPIDSSGPTSFLSLLKEHPVVIGGASASLVAGASYEMVKRLGRGYARLHHLQEAHDRLLEGADPHSKALENRMTDSERESYRSIMEKVYTVLHNQDYGQARAYMDKLQDGIGNMVKNYQCSTDAHSIEFILQDIEARLTDAANDMQATATPRSTPTTPGMA